MEGWNNCRGAWLPCQASLILGASQPRVWNHRNAPINLILPFAGVRLYPPLFALLPPPLSPLRLSLCLALWFFADSLAFAFAQLNTISYIRVLGTTYPCRNCLVIFPIFTAQSQSRRNFLDNGSMDPFLRRHREYHHYADKSGEVKNLSLY